MTICLWRDVPGYEGFYKVSNLGEVKSVDHYRRGINNCRQIVYGRKLKPAKAGKGYLFVGLSRYGKTKQRYVHHLVWLAFRGVVPPGKEINHKNGVKINCGLDNLELRTHRGNIRHAIANGLLKKHPVSGKFVA